MENQEIPIIQFSTEEPDDKVDTVDTGNNSKETKEETNKGTSKVTSKETREETNKGTSKKTNNGNSKGNSKKKKSKNGPLYYIALFVLLAVFIGCGIYLIRYYWASKVSEDKVDDLKDMIQTETADDEMEPFDPNKAEDAYLLPPLNYVEIDGVKVQKKFADLYEKNNDFLGWISLEDTNIDYPVMQSMYDEEFYLHKDFDKKYSAAGTLFIDTACNVSRPDENLLIYGHNMQTGKMFHDVVSYEKESFYKNHKYIQFDTIYENATYEVIAAFRTKILPADVEGFKYYQFVGPKDKEQFDDYIANIKALTPYTINTTAEYGDKLITLSTCAYHDKNGRYVVVAKKILTRR